MLLLIIPLAIGVGVVLVTIIEVLAIGQVTEIIGSLSQWEFLSHYKIQF